MTAPTARCRDSTRGSQEAQLRLPQLLNDLRDTRREQYNYLRLEDGGDEGAHEASISINVNSVLWAERVRSGAHSLVDVVTEASNRENRHAAWLVAFALVMNVLIALTVAGIATAAAVLSSRRLALGVPLLISHARQISSGDLSIGDPATNSPDEIGDLDRSFAEMVAYLQEMASHSESIASGDLAIEIHPRSAADTLGHAFLNMRNGLETMVREGRARATEVALCFRSIVRGLRTSCQGGRARS